MTTPIDWQKPIRTRDGKPARLLGIIDNPNSARTQIIMVGNPGFESCVLTHDSGLIWSDHINNEDVINVPAPKRSGTVWVNVFPDGPGHAQTTRALADEVGNGRLACVEVPWTEGQGL